MAGFLVDAQLPPRLARMLMAKRQQAVHVSEVGLLNAADADAARYAVDNGMIVITKDEDFVRLHTAGGGNPKVMWIRFGNTSNRELELSLRPKLDEVLTAFEQGEVLVEIR